MANPRPWTIDEDNLLKDAVAQYGDEAGMWKTIAQRVPGRTNKACRKRWLHSLSPTIKKTPWTPEEDALLLTLYATHKPARWSLIAKCISGRTDDACSKRYREALDPQLKRDEWTAEEDAKLLELTAQLGSRWTQVGHAMGRSGLGCRNRWRLLERKQRPRNAPRSSVNSESQTFHADASPYVPTQEGHIMPPCLPTHFQTPAFSTADASSEDHGNSSFSDESTAQAPDMSIDQSGGHASELIPASLGQAISRSLIHGPSPNNISTSSSLSGALASSSSSAVEAHQVPALDEDLDPELDYPIQTSSNYTQSPQESPVDDVTPMEITVELSEPRPLPTGPPVCAESPPEQGPSPVVIFDDRSNEVSASGISYVPPNDSTAESGTRKHGRGNPEEPLSTPPTPPRKKPRIRGSPSTGQDVSEHPRLSSHLPATLDPTILPYACGHPMCWPGSSGNGASRFATASEVAEHRRLGHPENDCSSAGEGSKAFRCALQGCGKGWKNINGIQYHLQISKAHFKAALIQTRVSTDPGTPSNEVPPETSLAGTVTPAKDRENSGQKGKRKEHHCPHEGCTNVYKQRTGLQYHLSHGHPTNIAQLETVPPSLMRKIVADSQQSASTTAAPERPAMTSLLTPQPEQENTPVDKEVPQ